MHFKCSNLGNCVKADHGELIHIAGEPRDPLCPVCDKPLITTVPSPAVPWGRIIAVLAALVAVVLVGRFVAVARSAQSTLESGIHDGSATISAGNSSGTGDANPVPTRSGIGATDNKDSPVNPSGAKPSSQLTTQSGDASASAGGTTTSTPSATDTPSDPDKPFMIGQRGNENTVLNFGVPILRETEAYRGRGLNWTPEERAKRLAYRLNDNLGDLHDHASEGVTVQNVLEGTLYGAPVVFFQYAKAEDGKMGDLMLTLDDATAKDCGQQDRVRLACWWRDLFRDYLLIDEGLPPAYPLNEAGQPTPPAPLVDLYARLQAVGVDQNHKPTFTQFQKVYGELLNTNRNAALDSLYRTVPDNYDPRPDNRATLNLRREDDNQ